MDLSCPKCKSEDTQKLTMVMSASGLFGKILRFGSVYVYNVWIPVASVFFGIAFGIAGGLITARLIASLLFGIAPTDAATFAGVCVVLLLAAAMASFIPAYRATRVDPMVALRNE